MRGNWRLLLLGTGVLLASALGPIACEVEERTYVREPAYRVYVGPDGREWREWHDSHGHEWREWRRHGEHDWHRD